MTLTRHEITYQPLDTLQPHPQNPKDHDVGAVMASIQRFGIAGPIVVDGRTGYILSGHGRAKALLALRDDGGLPPEGVEQTDDGEWVVPVMDSWSSRTDYDAHAAMIALNRTTELGGWDQTALVDLLEQLAEYDDGLDGVGYDGDDLDTLKTQLAYLDEPDEPARVPLVDRFGAPPFTVLDATQGYWQERKKAWLGLGIKSELGRDEDLVYDTPQRKYLNFYDVKNEVEQELGYKVDTSTLINDYRDRLQGPGGTSIFDPVLAELMIKWHTQPGQHVVDPWAGGSVRGIVSATLGRHYYGIDLSDEQVKENRQQAENIITDGPTPEWAIGDAREQLTELADASADMILGCPPYYDLEQYTDNPQDLSNLTVDAFDNEMDATLIEIERIMKPNTYAVLVVGSVRHSKGPHSGTVRDMRRAIGNGAERAGLHLQNDAVLVTPVGSISTTAARMFTKTRTLARRHQDILIFVKGDRKAAAEAAGGEQVSDAIDLGDDADDVDDVLPNVNVTLE